jgi:hypothetical protein
MALFIDGSRSGEMDHLQYQHLVFLLERIKGIVILNGPEVKGPEAC